MRSILRSREKGWVGMGWDLAWWKLLAGLAVMGTPPLLPPLHWGCGRLRPLDCGPVCCCRAHES